MYTEQMMLDQGYGDGDLALRLNQLKFYFRAVANAILDHKMHCTNMSDDEAMAFLIEALLPVGGRGAGQGRPRQARVRASCRPTSSGRTAFYNLRQKVQRETGRRVRPRPLSRGGAGPRHAAGEVSAELVRQRLKKAR